MSSSLGEGLSLALLGLDFGPYCIGGLVAEMKEGESLNPLFRA